MYRICKLILYSTVILSGFVPTAVFCLSKSVVIQEIQIAGDTSTDEYIVLKNISNEDVNITNWKLTKKTKSGKESTLFNIPSETILVLQDEIVIAHNNFSGNSDFKYSTKQSLANNNTLILYNNTAKIIDLVGWGATGEFENFATSNPKKHEQLVREGVDTDNNYLDFLILTNETTEVAKKETALDFAHTGAVIINEIYPNPKGSDTINEWIEIKNVDNYTIDITGWKLKDNSSSYTIDVDDIPNNLMNPGGILVLSREFTKIALNNTTDETLTLFDTNNNVSSSISYTEEVAEDTSLIWYEGSMEWTTRPTPWKENIFTLPEKVVLGDSVNEDTKAIEITKVDAVEAIADLKNNEEPEDITEHVPLEIINDSYIGKKITTSGIVVVEPNVFGKTYFYIANDIAGVKIYSSKKLFPKLLTGDEVNVTGTLSESRNELQLKTSSVEDVIVLKHKQNIIPQEIDLSDITEELEGSFITATGEVVDVSRAQFYIDDGEEEIKVYIPTNTNISTQSLQEGETVTITGILSETTTGYRILPRTQLDVSIQKETVLETKTENILIKSKKQNYNYRAIITPIIILLTGATLYFLNKKYRWSKKKNIPTNDMF